MDELTYDIVFAIVRESVSLFVLLVFLFLGYKVITQIIGTGVDKFDELIDAIRTLRKD